MSESDESNKQKKKNVYTRKLYKFTKVEDFFKSSSEELSDSVSFKKEIKPSEENEKLSKDKNILLINKQIKEKIINSKGSTSSSNKIKNNESRMEEEKDNNNEKKKTIKYEEIEESKVNEKDIDKITINNNEKNGKILNLNSSSSSSKKSSNRKIISSNNIMTSKEILKLNEDEKSNEEENIKNIMNNYVDSSYNSSKSKKNNSSINKKINNSNSKNSKKNSKNSKRSSYNYIERQSSRNIINNSLKKEDEIYFDSENESNNKHIINLMPTNVKAINKNSQKNKINLYKNKISTLQTTSEPQIQKEKENKNTEFKREIRITNRDNSINSSKSSNINEKKLEENKIKRFIEKKFFNIPILILMISINVYSLISSDIRHIWLDKNVDIYFDIINFIALLYFIFEIIILCLIDDTYLFSFIFWSDAIGTVCILINIEIVTNKIFGYDKRNESKKILNNSMEYFSVFIIMIERAIRAAQVLKWIKFINIIKTLKKLQNLFSEKQRRDLLKKENQKQKLFQKIKNIEKEEEIEESVISNESFRQTKNSFLNIKIKKEDEEEKEEENQEEKDDEELKEVKEVKEENSDNAVQRTKIKPQITKDIPSNTGNEEKTFKFKRAKTTKRMTKIFLRKESLRNIRQNNINERRNSIVGLDKVKVFNFEDEEEQKNEINRLIEEQMYKKIDENINNVKITNLVKHSIRKKIIIIFIILLIVCSILNEELFSFYRDKDNSLYYSYIFDFINKCPFNNKNKCFEKINNLLLNEDDFSIINITQNNILIYESNKYKYTKFRYCEFIKISSKNKNINETINIIYSIKKENNIKHIFYLILTIILCISLILSSILSESDLTDILLTPFEVMIEVADKVSKDPINAKNIKELEQGVIDILQKNKNKSEKKLFNNDINKTYNECYKSYEVKAIMNAIIKISALLAMSLGEAGGEIIHKNLSSQFGIHLHSRGKKKIAIFGFCNIRNFEEINIALEEETIPLINKIAEIVQSSVERFRGNTNKNIGDSFLNVWKFYNNLNTKNFNDKRLKKDNLLEIDPTNPQINITADCAVLAYLRCILKINKNLNILEYKKDKRLKSIIPNFKIDMGFGLHLGYGIEGPVGSEFKMEASYLSPNVNIAARLETATKQFGVNLLISGKLYNLFTEDMKELCRYVDCVTVKGSTEPIDLYTIDINYLITPQRKEKIKIVANFEEKAKIFKEKKAIIEGFIEEYGSITPIILEKKSYWELIDEKTDEFYDMWEKAMDFYKKGKWEDAKKYLENCLKEDSKDGPANTIYNYIKKFKFHSPEDWKGERELTAK